MELKTKTIITLDGDEYITIATTNYKGKEYALSNKIAKGQDEVTNEYYVFTIENNEIVYVRDNELINTLFPIFQEIIRNELEKIMKGDNE